MKQADYSFFDMFNLVFFIEDFERENWFLFDMRKKNEFHFLIFLSSSLLDDL